MPPELTVVIPTHNRRERLERLLRSLESQTAPNQDFDVIVVVDGASDGTEKMLNAFQVGYQLAVVSTTQGGPARARNEGAARATGTYLLFVDDDMIAAPRACRRASARPTRGERRRRSWQDRLCAASPRGAMEALPGGSAQPVLRRTADEDADVHKLLGRQSLPLSRALQSPSAASVRNSRVQLAAGISRARHRARLPAESTWSPLQVRRRGPQLRRKTTTRSVTPCVTGKRGAAFSS